MKIDQYDLCFQPQHEKKMFGSHHSHSYNKKKLQKLKMDDFSWLHQRTEVVGQIPTMNSGETGDSRESQPKNLLTWNRSSWRYKLVS